MEREERQQRSEREREGGRNDLVLREGGEGSRGRKFDDDHDYDG